MKKIFILFLSILIFSLFVTVVQANKFSNEECNLLASEINKSIANMHIDKITILSFVFTSCPDACPIMSENFSILQERFKDSDLIQFVSITVDPEYDSSDILEAFSEKYSNNNNWYFLRGDINYISTLSEKGFFLSASLLPAGHSTRFVLIDKQKNIRKYYEGTDDAAIMELQNDIVFLVNEKV